MIKLISDLRECRLCSSTNRTDRYDCHDIQVTEICEWCLTHIINTVRPSLVNTESHLEGELSGYNTENLKVSGNLGYRGVAGNWKTPPVIY
jgi:hypothetical protein